jgi:hypothetical protein
MELKLGDNVRTESGEVGKIIHIDCLTVFVAFAIPPKAHDIKAFLASELTLVDPLAGSCDELAPTE